MPDLISDSSWGEPILPVFHDPEWEKQVKSEMGMVPDILKRVSRSKWLRYTYLKWSRIPATEMPVKLVDIGALITAQENACRYCYGIAKSQMRMLGYSEKMINQIEREMQLAELEEKERAFIRFCRSLARSKPRPAKKDRAHLVALGFTPKAVAEMSFSIAANCFFNRIATFMACPPELGIEKMAGNFVGRIFRPFIAKKLRSIVLKESEFPEVNPSAFPWVMEALAGLPSALYLSKALEEAFDSEVLSKELKILMFAVVARSLDCTFCQNEALQMSLEQGFTESEFNGCLSSLTSSRLDAKESKILTWTRETVHFQTGTIQKKTQLLANELDEVALLESIGVAALANSTVRLAMLME